MQNIIRTFFGLSILSLLLCIVVGVFLGTGAYTYHYAEGFSYFSDNPQSCVNCHIMRDHYDGWQHASHHSVATCNDCHTPHDLVGKYWTKAENGFHHSKAFTLQDYHDPLMARPVSSRIVENNCVTCHQDTVSSILTSEAREDGGAESCIRCHASVGHGPNK